MTGQRHGGHQPRLTTAIPAHAGMTRGDEVLILRPRAPTGKLAFMFGIRLLLVLLALVAVVLILRRLYRRPSAARPLAVPGQMVRCAHCGLYLPRDEALHADDLDFCSADHRDRHRQG